jgi:hypothetical protein
MRFFALQVLLISVLLFVVGCDNDIGGFQKEELSISFTTFNARMGEDLPYLDLRKEKLADTLKELDSDVVCIQEVFDKKDIKTIKDFLGSEDNQEKYKYSWNLITDNENNEEIPAACTQNDITSVGLCIAMNCMGDGNLDPICIATECMEEIMALPPDCRNCLLGEITGIISGEGDIMEILMKCTVSQKIEYKYSGNNGVVLLSKYPLKDRKFATLSSTGISRAVVYATLGKMESEDKDGNKRVYEPKPGIGDVQIICTGLSKPIDGEGYDGPFGSWEQERIVQASEILELETDDDVVQRVILGDFAGNIAGGTNIYERNPGAISYILNEGWYDPYFDVHRDHEIGCSVCPENPMVKEDEPGYVPDHIFFKNKKGYAFESKRVLINKFVHLDYEAKEKIRFSVSDHYAVSTTMTVDKQ